MSEEKKEMPQAAELKPCPFCSAQMGVRKHSAFHPENDCWLATAGEHGTYELDEMDYPAWNRRSPPSPSVGRDWPPPKAIETLRQHQTQLDMDGINVGVSREALDVVLAYFERDLGSGFALGGPSSTPSAPPNWQPFRPVCGKCGKPTKTVGGNDGALTVYPCKNPACLP